MDRLPRSISVSNLEVARRLVAYRDMVERRIPEEILAGLAEEWEFICQENKWAWEQSPIDGSPSSQSSIKSD